MRGIIFLALGMAITTIHSDGFADTHDWIRYIAQGHEVKVIFDETKDKFDDSEFEGMAELDPLGTLKGGETYTVRYVDRQFSCRGYNQYYDRADTWTYSNGSPFDSQLSLWGYIFVFDGEGNIYFEDYGLVGHMKK
ncbi:MAG: hypothetical protein ACYTG0_34425 [Planctomycetota bacterium]|jgi:hypothetical protein